MAEQDNIQQYPLVSIIITSYNRAGLINRAIQSAVDQDYPNLEIIIADNCSTDQSIEVIRKYADRRIKLFQNPANIGMLPNFKKATADFAKGELIAYVSSDDYLVNEKFISDAVEKFNKYKTLTVFSGISRNMYLSEGKEEHNPSYQYKKSKSLLDKLLPGNFVFTEFQYMHLLNFGGTVFYRQDMIDMDVFRENNTHYADLQVILLLALKGDVYLSGEVSYVQTFHEANASQVQVNAQQALLNLSFAELPYEAAKKHPVSSELSLDQWLQNILKPIIYKTMIGLYENNKPEYKIYTDEIKLRYPLIFKEINRKWKFIILTYRHPFFRKVYFKYLEFRNAKR